MSLTERIKRLQSQIDALTLRERLMLLAATLVVAGGLWEALLASPLAAREARATAQVKAAQQRIEQLDQAMALAAQGIGDGMAGQLERLRQLEQQVESSGETVRVFTSDLVDPTQMRQVLEGLIERQRDLRLVRAKNLEVLPLIEQAQEDEATASGETMLFRHGLRLELEGNYLDFLSYLEAVEQLPWQLYWGALNLTVLDYPQNAITLELYTLSLDESWIGV